MVELSLRKIKKIKILVDLDLMSLNEFVDCILLIALYINHILCMKTTHRQKQCKANVLLIK